MKAINLVILIILLCSTYPAFSLECAPFKTKHILKGKTITSHEDICLRQTDKKLSASSKKCQMMDKDSCPFSTLKKGPDYQTFVRPQGSPGFNLCHSLEGSPQLYQIEIKGKWMPFERCFWKGTTEFVDIDYLILYYSSL